MHHDPNPTPKLTPLTNYQGNYEITHQVTLPLNTMSLYEFEHSKPSGR
jgi:hypothetical protein